MLNELEHKGYKITSELKVLPSIGHFTSYAVYDETGTFVGSCTSMTKAMEILDKSMLDKD